MEQRHILKHVVIEEFKKAIAAGEQQQQQHQKQH